MAINEGTDQGIIDNLNTYLAKLNTGVSAWAVIEQDDSSRRDEIGYLKFNKKWQICLRRTSIKNLNSVEKEIDELEEEKTWAFKDAPEDLRLAGIDAIEILLDKINEELEILAPQLESAVAAVKPYADAFASGVVAPSSKSVPRAAAEQLGAKSMEAIIGIGEPSRPPTPSPVATKKLRLL
jgi:hypothetical protein